MSDLTPDTPTSHDGPLSHRGESPRRFCSRGQCDSGDLWVSRTRPRTRPPELAELGPSAEAWTVDFVLHRTRQDSTICGSLDVCLIYRRGQVDSETCGSESVSWWVRMDLNYRPQHYECCGRAYLAIQTLETWCSRYMTYCVSEFLYCEIARDRRKAVPPPRSIASELSFGVPYPL
jgi:hypothetical protein